jgi:hypothetical protein
MSLPRSYLTSSKNLNSILVAIKTAQAPNNFTLKFLESLEFTSSSDRLVIGVLQSLGFLTADKKPTDRYFRFLDQTQSDIVLAEAIRDAYSDLFQINKNAQELSKPEAFNKFKTLTQGRYSESVLDKMAMTFVELCKLADFKAKPATSPAPDAELKPSDAETHGSKTETRSTKRVSLDGLHYHINLILPESRDPAVYEALFRSLKEHLL